MEIFSLGRKEKAVANLRRLLLFLSDGGLGCCCAALPDYKSGRFLGAGLQIRHIWQSRTCQTCRTRVTDYKSVTTGTNNTHTKHTNTLTNSREPTIKLPLNSYQTPISPIMVLSERLPSITDKKSAGFPAQLEWGASMTDWQ